MGHYAHITPIPHFLRSHNAHGIHEAKTLIVARLVALNQSALEIRVPVITLPLDYCRLATNMELFGDRVTFYI